MRFAAWFSALLLFSNADPARADLDLGRALESLRAAQERPDLALRVPVTLRVRQRSHLALLVERSDALATSLPDAVPVAQDWFVLYANEARVRELSTGAPGHRLFWSPPRRLLLDRADGFVRASSVRAQTGATGRGVIIGMVDTGIDVLHPDLRNADGSTRVRWWIEFGKPAIGRHARLENELGCQHQSSACAIYSAADINALIDNERPGDEPSDAFGHGTHTASLAAGNGRSTTPARYVGVAPEADLIIAKVTDGASSGIQDADILRAARFVFERARDLGAPAILNLSLGSDFGAHDGSSALERALSSFVGASEPGRAIVVAAGNSATLHVLSPGGITRTYGVHTRVHVPWHSPVRVPLLTPTGGTQVTRAAIYIWVGLRRGDRVSIGLERDGKPFFSPVASGSGKVFSDGTVEVVLLNGVRDSGSQVRPDEPAAVIVIDGTWPAGTTFDIHLAGHGTASLWAQSEGDLDPTRSIGALFPFATQEGTINVPASAPALIAVGATLNRTDWQDYRGESIVHERHGRLEHAPPDTTAYFSSAGPNALGILKPDIVAPGAWVVGAMASSADPRRAEAAGMFSHHEACAPGYPCLVVDDFHAVSAGTSMAAPLVTGAVALLFERDPRLTQEGVRALLQAGARPLQGAVFLEQQTGTGALDIEGSVAAQLAETSPIHRLPGRQSWLSLSASHARPDPEWPLFIYVELRDDHGRIADGFDPRRLGIALEGAQSLEPITRLAPGLYRASIVAPPGSGGRSLNLAVTFDGSVLLSRSVPIAVDPGAATGLVSARGGCAMAFRREPPTALPWLLGVAWAATAWCVRRRRRNFSETRSHATCR